MANVRKVGEPKKPPVVLSEIPSGREAVVERYGDPLASNFVAANLRPYRLPYPMRYSWRSGKVEFVQAHHLVADSMLDALEEFLDLVGFDEIVARGWDEYGGCYNLRMSVNSPEHLSTHSWGIAIDLNPTLNPNGQKECKQPPELVQAFVRRGWMWVPGDYMHTQACVNY